MLASLDRRRTLDADSDPGLQNAVTCDNDAFIGVNDRLIQRVGQGADHALADPRGSSVSESRVITKRTPESMGRLPTFSWKAVKLGAQQVVQVHQFAALTLPSHPESFSRVVNAMAMEEKERSHALSGIFLVELGD